MSATQHQLEEARRRLALVEALPRYASLSAAETALGEPKANLCRYRKMYRLGGHTLTALMPATDQAGRPALVDVLSSEEIAEARRWLLKTESIPLAFEFLADGPLCSHASRELLNRYRERSDYPPSLVKAIRFTEEEWDQFKGKKHAQGSAYTTRRGMFEILDGGARREIAAGDVVEADDVSTDVPYYVQLPDGSFSVGRQLLVFRDLRSRKYLYACAVAREKDSYRAEDIVRAARWLIEAHGLPGRFRFERGSWEAGAIMGHDDEASGRKWGGLAQLLPVQHMFSSNGKTIEGGFRLLHKVMGAYGVRIGKTRGEYEQPTADMIAVNAGKKHPKDCGFIAWADLLTTLEKAFTKINGRATYDRYAHETTTPDDLWMRDLQARPGKRLPVCPPDFFFHFLPVKRLVSVGAVQAGHVQVSLPDYPAPFVFRCAGIDPATNQEIPYLDRLHKVWVCFDPHEAAAGAVIFNAEPSDATRNRGGYRPLERLFTAPLSSDRPQLDHRSPLDRGPDADQVAKKIRTAQVRAAGTSIGVFGKGSRRVQHTHDGAGNVSRMESGAAAHSPAPRVDAAPAQPVRAARTERARPEDIEDMSDDFTPTTPVGRKTAALDDYLNQSRTTVQVETPAIIFEDLT